MRAQADVHGGAPDAPDVIITEIGGTVGDIESLPFLEAARQVRHDIGRDNVFFLHVSLVPYLAPSGELKTKPTQHSVAALRQVGIQPDALVLRADREIPDPIKRKISLMCDVDVEAVAAAVDAPSIYDIPKVLHREGLDAYVIRRLGLPSATSTGPTGTSCSQRVHDPEHDVEIALVGKYIDLPDAYLSVTEALRAGGFHHDAKVRIRWVASDECQTEAGAQQALGGVDAVLVPGGFGVRGIEGKLGALTLGPRDSRCRPWASASACSAWSSSTPATSLGIDGRELDASSTPTTRAPGHRDDGGAEGLRRGRRRPRRHHAPRPLPGRTSTEGQRRARSLRRHAEVEERHRHRYEVNNSYRERARGGRPASSPAPRPTARWSSSSSCPREVHPYYVSTQAHPEFLSRPNRAHPLFAGLVGAALERQRAARLVEVERHAPARDRVERA